MPHGIENLSPISHMRKLRLRDTQQLVQRDTAILVVWVQSAGLESKTPRASRGEQNVLLQRRQRCGDVALALNFGQKKRATGGDPLWLQKAPRLRFLPRRG